MILSYVLLAISGMSCFVLNLYLVRFFALMVQPLQMVIVLACVKSWVNHRSCLSKWKKYLLLPIQLSATWVYYVRLSNLKKEKDWLDRRHHITSKWIEMYIYGLVWVGRQHITTISYMTYLGHYIAEKFLPVVKGQPLSLYSLLIVKLCNYVSNMYLFPLTVICLSIYQI